MRKLQSTTQRFGIAAGFLAAILLIASTAADAQEQITGVLAERILDMEIVTTNGENVGEIENIIFDRNGKIRKFIIDVGGFLDIGDRQVAVSTQELKYDTGKGYAVYQGTRSKLENKPEVDLYAYGGYPYGHRRNFGRGYGPYPYSYDRDPYYYGPYPAPAYPPRGYYPARDARVRDDRMRGDMRGQGREDMRGQRPQEQRQDRRFQVQGDQERMQRGDRWYSDSGYLGRLEGQNLLLSAVMDADILNQWGEVIGEIENLVINKRGRITHAVAETGGFWDIGDEEVVVAFDQLENVGPYFAMYPGTQEQLSNLPQFDEAQFVDQFDQESTEMQQEAESAAQQAESAAKESAREGGRYVNPKD